MKRKPTEGENFRIETSPDSLAHASLLHGEVAGEITTDKVPRVERRAPDLDKLAGLFLRDAELAHDWQETENAFDALARLEALLDRVNDHRRALEASDADPAYKDARQTMLSDLANRLRELI